MSRLHPALLKPETLYTLLRHRIIEEIRRRQNDQFRKDHEQVKNNKGSTNGEANKLLRLTKPYYVPTLSLKKYMLQKAGTKYGMRVQRASKMYGMRVQRSAKDPEKLPLFVSVMKNRFHGVKRSPGYESGLSLLDIYFKRHGRTNNINKKPKYRIVCTLSCFVQRVY